MVSLQRTGSTNRRVGRLVKTRNPQSGEQLPGEPPEKTVAQEEAPWAQRTTGTKLPHEVALHPLLSLLLEAEKSRLNTLVWWIALDSSISRMSTAAATSHHIPGVRTGLSGGQ